MIFVPNFVCVLTNERYQTLKQDFHSVARVIAQGSDLEMLGGQKLNFSKHDHVAYQMEGDGEKNRIQVKFSPYGKLVTFGWVKRSNIIKFLRECEDLRWRPIDYTLVLLCNYYMYQNFMCWHK